MSRRPRATIGFTLMELLVVMGIAMVLLAISVPVTQNIAAGNALARCNIQLQQIGQALKIYHLDYGAVPRCYPLDPSIATGDPYTELDGPRVLTGEIPGLIALWYGGYLGNKKALNCPRDTLNQDARELGYYQSYAGRDPDAKTQPGEPYELFNNYKYLSTRGIIDPTDPDYYRQLDPAWFDPDLSQVMPEINTDWHPDDTTVVTWCNWHTDTITRGGEPQYLVLFWDGSVSSMPADLLRTDAVRAAAWRVHPSDELP